MSSCCVCLAILDRTAAQLGRHSVCSVILCHGDATADHRSPSPCHPNPHHTNKYTIEASFAPPHTISQRLFACVCADINGAARGKKVCVPSRAALQHASVILLSVALSVVSDDLFTTQTDTVSWLMERRIGCLSGCYTGKCVRTHIFLKAEKY